MPKSYASATVGEPGPGQNVYGAGLNGARLTIYAPSLYLATKAAFEFWSPLKKDVGYLWCRLSQLADAPEPVSHVPDF